MKYIHMQRRTTADLITIGEYIRQLQPNIFRRLYWEYRLYVKDVTELVTAAADISGKDKLYAAVMTERPKGGRGGLLPWEGEDAL
jgi:hypothetical protein